jgi:RNA polymerase sigma factor (sigma-70 family)
MTGSSSPADGGGGSSGRRVPPPPPDPSAPLPSQTPPSTPSAFARSRARVVGPARAAAPQQIGGSGGGLATDWFAGVVRQYEQPLVLYAARITRDLERARDVVQEAFLKLAQMDRQDVEPRLAEWLYTVCRNRSLDVRRKEKRVSPLAEGSVERQEAVDPLPDEHLERRESADQALRLLERLPDNQQEVIRLRFQHGMSYQQISDVTGLSVSNVGFLLHVGLKALRERMGRGR